MAAKAYVLIDAEAGKVKSVAGLVRSKAGVSTADIVTGSHDVIAVVEGPDAEAVARAIISEIDTIKGVSRTTTCLVMQAK